MSPRLQKLEKLVARWTGPVEKVAQMLLLRRRCSLRWWWRWQLRTFLRWTRQSRESSSSLNWPCGFHEEMLRGEEAVCNLLHWKSGKLHRTINSTLAAETQALARGVGDLLWMMVMYLEMVDPMFQLRDWRKAVKRYGYTAFTKYDDKEELAGALAIVDAKSLYDLLAHATTGGTDRRTALDVQVLREELTELSGCIRWVDHMHMPADCLTKKSGRAESLIRMLESGRFGVTEEAITLNSRLQDRQTKGYNRRWFVVSQVSRIFLELWNQHGNWPVTLSYGDLFVQHVYFMEAFIGTRSPLEGTVVRQKVCCELVLFTASFLTLRFVPSTSRKATFLIPHSETTSNLRMENGTTRANCVTTAEEFE